MVSLKLPPPIGQTVFENTMQNPLLTFLNAGQSGLKKNVSI